MIYLEILEEYVMSQKKTNDGKPSPSPANTNRSRIGVKDSAPIHTFELAPPPKPVKKE